MTFNNNLGNNYSRRGGSAQGPSAGGFGSMGSGGSGGGNILFALISGLITRKFGIPGLIVVAALAFFFGGGSNLFNGANNQQQHNSSGADNFSHCDSAQAANEHDDCRILATQASLDQVWGQILPDEAGIDYRQNNIMIAEGQISTACGSANINNTGPFYCSGDETTYMSIPFFKQIKSMGGSNGPFAQMYVTAHEMGHHIQHLQGTLGLSDYDNPGADSDAVKIEVQADCYAGVWAANADKGPHAFLDPITQEQVEQALSTVQSVGDDAIQRSAGQEVDSDKWTHGSSAQRVEWFMRGYQGGTMDACKQDFNR